MFTIQKNPDLITLFRAYQTAVVLGKPQQQTDTREWRYIFLCLGKLIKTHNK